MARTLKTYVTSMGFFDLAVAAPSMKAALQAWGAERNLFQHGYAKETQDPQIIAAAMAKPGIVLKRAVGSSGQFREHAELPKSLPLERPKEAPRLERAQSQSKVVNLEDERAARRAAIAFEKEQARRAKEIQKEEAVKARERERREEAVGKAQAALEHAKERHEKIMESLETERESLDRRAKAEEARWEKEKERLETALRSARD
jgi:hypothetical protein